MYSIAVDLPVPLPEGTPLPSAFPALAYAVRGLAQAAQWRWLEYAAGRPLPDGRSIQAGTGTYARSIRMVQNSDFAYTVEATAPHAQSIEEGSPQRDMKTMLRTSLKVRITKDGRRYLIIPFRHGTPGTVGMGKPMPEFVHALAKDLKPSRVSGSTMTPNAIGVHDIKTRDPVMITRRSYNWGDRLDRDDSRRRYHGMVRFADPVSGGHSQFMTFRKMVEGSAGWIRPATPGYWPARTTAADIRAIDAEGILRAALERDVQRYLGMT